jgi:hypothetical protein
MRSMLRRYYRCLLVCFHLYQCFRNIQHISFSQIIQKQLIYLPLKRADLHVASLHMPAKRKGRENRRDHRVEVAKGLWVAWRADGSPTVSRVRDLSMGGVFISTNSPLNQGSEIHLLFSLPEGEVRVKGRVRRATAQGGMGVEFTSISDADLARLKELIARLNA